MKEKRPYNPLASEATSAWADERKLRPQLGSVELSIVTAEVFPIVGDEHGSSIGAQIDAILADRVNGDMRGQVQDIHLHLFPDQLDAVHAYYKGG
jgi:hypothetical protein